MKSSSYQGPPPLAVVAAPATVSPLGLALWGDILRVANGIKYRRCQMETKGKVKCKLCGHEWTTRIDAEPCQCPKCKSPYWNKGAIRT